jgi:hypothetical protein
MAEKNSLWKNIRNKAAKNRRTGAKPKKPTAEMLRQEAKIKAKKADGGPVGNDGLYNMQRALELGYTPDETGHWPSVDSETGMFLKSKEHPTAWMEYLYGHALNPELNRTTNVVVNPEGYFGENQLQYIPKAQGGYVDGDKDKNKKPKTRIYTDPKEFKKAEQVYNDSLSLYNVSNNKLKEYKNFDFGEDFEFKKYENAPEIVRGDNPLMDYWNGKNGIKPFQIAYDTNHFSRVKGAPVMPIFKKPEVKPILGKSEIDYLPSKSFTNNNVKPGAVGNIQDVQPLEINEDDFYEGQYEKYRTSPYGDPMNRVWISGKGYEVVGDEKLKELNDQYLLKDLNKKATGGYMYPEGGPVNSSNGSGDFEKSSQTTTDFFRQWYKGRSQNPKFKDVANSRLDLINSKPYPTTQIVPYSEMSNQGEYNPVDNTIRYSDRDLNNSYYNNNVNSLMTHERDHYLSNKAPQEFINANSVIDENVKQKKAWLSNEDASRQDEEIRARLSVWRQMNNIDPTKDYSPKELRSIINKNLDDENLDSNIKDLYEVIKFDPEQLKYFNDSFVSNPQTTPYKQYAARGGFIDPPDGSSGFIQPTRADSLMLYNNALEKIKFYKGNPDYEKYPNNNSDYSTNFKDSNTRKNLIKNNLPFGGGRLVDQSLLNNVENEAKRNQKPLTASEKAALKKQLNKNKFGSVSGTNLTSFGDILSKGSDGYYNPLAPPIYLHPNISPQGSEYYVSDRFADASEVPRYDPLAVAPWDTLNESQRNERVRKYGRAGVPSSWNSSPPPPPRNVRPNINKLQSKQLPEDFDSIGIVGSPQQLPPTAPMDASPDGHYRVARVSPYADPYYQVWENGSKWRDVSPEEFDKISQEKYLTEYSKGGGVGKDGGTKVLNRDGLLIAPTLPEFEVVLEANPYGPVTGAEYLESNFNPINWMLPSVEPDQPKFRPDGTLIPASGRVDIDNTLPLAFMGAKPSYANFERGVNKVGEKLVTETPLKNAYKLNPNLQNPLGYRNLGDNPHWWKGFTKEVTPETIDLENGFKQYKELLKLKDKKLYKLVDKNKIDYGDYFTAITNYESDLIAKSPFGRKLGMGSYGSVYEFKNHPEKAIKFASPYGNKWTPKLIEEVQSMNTGNIAIPNRYGTFEVANHWKNTKPNTYEVSIMDNLNKTNFGKVDLSARDSYALFLKQARKLRDKGIGLDMDNTVGNIKFNPNKGVYDIYDVNPKGFSYNPEHYMHWVNANAKRMFDKGDLTKVKAPRKYTPEELKIMNTETPREYSQGGFLQYDGDKNKIQKAVASTTAVNTRALPEGLFESIKANPPARQPQIVNIVDKRKQNPITKGPINPNKDLVGGQFEDTIPIEIIKSSYKHGVDPGTALSVGLLESRMGTTDPNVGHIMVDPYSDYMPSAEDMVLMIKQKQEYAKKLGYTDPLLQLQAYNGLGVLSNKKGEIGKYAYGLPIPKEGIDLRQNPLYGKKAKNVRDSVIMQSPDLIRLMDYYKPKMNGGPINQTMYYSGGPMEYGNGGRVLKHIGAGAYALGEGMLDTITMGATDQLTDKGFEGLTKLGNKNMDLNDPANARFLKTQQQIKGYGNTAAAVTTGILTGNVQGAVTQGAKGLNTAFQASDWASDDFKKWSGISSQAIGIGAGLAGGALNTTGTSASASEAAGKVGEISGKVSPYVNQAVGMFGSNQQPMWQQAQAQQDLLNSPEYAAQQSLNNQQYVNQGLSFSHGGNITNNSLNLQSMKGRYQNYKQRMSKGGTFNQYGIDMIPDSAGLHHESAYGGVPIGPDALAEGGEIKMDTPDGGQYIVSDQVDGTESQMDFTFTKGGKYKELNRTLAEGMKQDLNRYSFGSLATNSNSKDSLRRPNDSYAKSTIDQIKQKWQQKTEFARQRSQQEQAIAQAEEQKRLIEEEYIAAYGGKINPKKYPGLNRSKKSKGGYVYNAMTQPMLAHGGPVVSNIQQPFNGPAAQNRGGMMMANGGMMQQQGGQDQMMQLIQAYADAVGVSPEEIIEKLQQMDPQSQKQVIQQMAQELQGGQQQSMQQQMPPQQGMMARGGKKRSIQPMQSIYTPFTNNEMPGLVGNIEPMPGLSPYATMQDFSDQFTSEDYQYSKYLDKDKPAPMTGPVVSQDTQLTPEDITALQYQEKYGQSGQFTADLIDNQSNKAGFTNLYSNTPKTIVQPSQSDVNPTVFPQTKGSSTKSSNQPNQPNEGLTGLDYASMGMQALGPLSQLYYGLKGPDDVNYERMSIDKIDPYRAITLANEESRRAQDTAGYNLRQNAPTSGSYMSNMRGLGLQAGKQRGAQTAATQYQADVANTQMQNQANAQNAQISMQEQIDRLQEQDAARTNVTEGLSGLGSSTANMIRDYRTNEVNQTIANNIGTSDFKYDPTNKTVTFRTKDGNVVTVPAESVTTPNVGTGKTQTPTTSQFQTNFDENLNRGFKSKFRGINSGKA